MVHYYFSFHALQLSPVARYRRLKRRKKEKENTRSHDCSKMYIEKVVEGALTRMPVKNVHIATADLPMDNARDPTMDSGSIKRNSTPSSFKSDGSAKRRAERSHSVCSYSDDDSDVELDNYFKSLRNSKPGDSRQDTSSPEEVIMYHDISRRALQENARVRNPRRISSPHRSPLHVTQDQARVCSPRSPAFPKRIHERDTDLGFIPKRFKSSGQAFRRLDLSEQSIKVHKPLKQKGINPPTAVFSNSSDSDCLPAVKWTPKKEKTKIDESRHHSAFNTPHRTQSAPETHDNALDMLRTRSRPEEGHRTQCNRSAFEFLQSFSNSETSDGEDRTSKRMVSTPSKLIYFRRERVKSEASRPPLLPRSTFTTKTEQKVKTETSETCEVKSEVADFSELYLASIPTHVKTPVMCNKCESVEESNKLPFGILLHTLLEGCQEEGHHNEGVDFIHHFTNVRRCPPKDCMDYIIHDLLMKVDSKVLLANSFNTLKHIQNLHLPTRQTFVVEWKLLRTVMKEIVSPGAAGSTLLQGNMLVLKFITSVFGEEMETCSKDGTLGRSYVHSLLSADTCIANIRDLIQWICMCVERIHEEENLQLVDNASSLHQHSTTTNNTTPSGHLQNDSSHTRLSTLLSVLRLLQKLLHMCLVVSPNLGQSAEKIADEFLYCYQRLPKYYHKKRVLQTITCHPMRVKLLELILSNCYKVGDNVLDQGSLSISVSKIVEYYFKHIPSSSSSTTTSSSSPYDDCYDDEASDDEDEDAATKDVDCEELAMLLLYLMQSYLWSTNGVVPETDRYMRMRLLNHQSLQANQLMPYGKFKLSMSDKEYLITMGDFVEGLQARLEQHCPKLTNLTLVYLRQLDAMRDLVDFD